MEKLHSGCPRTCRLSISILAGSQSIFTEIPLYKFISQIGNKLCLNESVITLAVTEQLHKTSSELILIEQNTFQTPRASTSTALGMAATSLTAAAPEIVMCACVCVCVCACVHVRTLVSSGVRNRGRERHRNTCRYGVATISRLPKNSSFFCKRAI